MHSRVENGRSLAAIVADMKEELRQFVQIRIEMLKQELHEKSARLKLAAPLAAVGMVLLGTAYLLITLSLVPAVSAAFANRPYRWFFGFLIVGFVWALLGGVAAYFAKRELELKTLAPRRTIEVLKGDKVWLQREIKKQA